MIMLSFLSRLIERSGQKKEMYFNPKGFSKYISLISDDERKMFMIESLKL